MCSLWRISLDGPAATHFGQSMVIVNDQCSLSSDSTDQNRRVCTTSTWLLILKAIATRSVSNGKLYIWIFFKPNPLCVFYNLLISYNLMDLCVTLHNFRSFLFICFSCCFSFLSAVDSYLNYFFLFNLSITRIIKWMDFVLAFIGFRIRSILYVEDQHE